MKSEEELKDWLKKVEEAGKVDGDEAFFVMSNKCGHWCDCIDWILKN